VKTACAGGGPASLYFSILMKRQDPSHDIAVYGRNPAGSTCGWGVTYWAGPLDKLRAGNPASDLVHYERDRKSALLYVRSAARRSPRWYENLPR